MGFPFESLLLFFDTEEQAKAKDIPPAAVCHSKVIVFIQAYREIAIA